MTEIQAEENLGKRMTTNLEMLILSQPSGSLSDFRSRLAIV